MIGFLHTSPVHVETFDRLTRQASADTETTHLVDESLLERARRDGVDSVAADVSARVHQLRDAGARVIVCTCSTIGDLAERFSDDVPVTRVDRPMARTAVACGPRVGVIAAVESTLEPTRSLLEEEASAAGTSPSIELALVDGAWSAFEAGNTETYLRLIVDAARELAHRTDVIVLAQASMAAAEPGLADLAVPVLSSPAAAVRHAVAELVRRQSGPAR
ncbi:aspartate/glutamate racemase family protein [Nocardioides jensenii]|uniref:aspartate/glutamate racemase family protein n=1 Tax=Nocardioides jensenii TaxID=1843 RepID=UPI000A7B3A79|nr:aspartate/glutamate racemase family protein [Nocardioides jensenii]